MGIWSGLLRRLGYARLREYNLRATADGMLVPISSQVPVPIDLTHMGLSGPLPDSPRRFAKGTQDGVQPVRRHAAARRRSVSDTEPMPPPTAFEDDEPTEIVGSPPAWEER